MARQRRLWVILAAACFSTAFSAPAYAGDPLPGLPVSTAASLPSGGKSGPSVPSVAPGSQPAGAAQPVADAVRTTTQAVNGATTTAKDAVSTGANTAKDGATPVVSTATATVNGVVATARETTTAAVKDATTPPLATVKETVDAASNTVKQTVDAASNTVKETADTALPAVNDTVDRASETLGEAAGSAAETVRKAADGPVLPVVSTVDPAVSAVPTTIVPATGATAGSAPRPIPAVDIGTTHDGAPTLPSSWPGGGPTPGAPAIVTPAVGFSWPSLLAAAGRRTLGHAGGSGAGLDAPAGPIAVAPSAPGIRTGAPALWAGGPSFTTPPTPDEARSPFATPIPAPSSAGTVPVAHAVAAAFGASGSALVLLLALVFPVALAAPTLGRRLRPWVDWLRPPPLAFALERPG